MPAQKGNKYAAGNKGGGRKTNYKAEYAKEAFGYALLGATDVMLAELFGVGETTINAWKKAHKEFSEALKDGKYKADAKVTRSLYEKAVGYEREEEEIKIIEGKVERVKVKRYYPSDGRSAEYWLNNRQRSKFRAKHIEDDQPPVIIAVKVSKEEAKDIADAIKADI